MDAALASLRAAHPWPSRRPPSGSPLQGWLGDGNKRMLEALLPRGPCVVVELGSWLGLSARFMLERRPQATLVCVDTWEGSVEHKAEARHQAHLPTLHASFLHNLWDLRGRVVPVRAFSWDGLEEVARHGVRPDLVYVDASHETPDVLRDLATALRLFPDAILMGDDWRWRSVRRAVVPFARRNGLWIRTDGNCFRLEPSAGRRPPALHYAATVAGAAVRRAARKADRRVVWPVVRRLRRRAPARAAP